MRLIISGFPKGSGISSFSSFTGSGGFGCLETGLLLGALAEPCFSFLNGESLLHHCCWG